MPRTRLAPSPTGALHLGNARTFLLTWAMARNAGWAITLRIEDLDTPRVRPGVTELTIDLLAWLGLDWDDGPFIQSATPEPHLAAMHRLASRGLVYPCELSRAQILAAASAPQEGAHDVAFPAALRPAAFPTSFEDTAPSWRFSVPSGPTSFHDNFAGSQSFDISAITGDFVIWTRRDRGKPGQPAYQLAVVVDDVRQGVTHVVRGDDLLDSAARQILLYRALDLAPLPAYFHLPLVVGPDGRRLAKRHGDTRLDRYRAAGVTAQRVIGLCAYWSGLIPTRRPCTASEFRVALAERTISPGPVTLSAEDERWLTER